MTIALVAYVMPHEKHQNSVCFSITLLFFGKIEKIKTLFCKATSEK